MPKPVAKSLVPKERLVQQVRDEASEVKDCFTRFSFQAIALSASFVGVAFGVKDQLEYAELAALPLIVLLAVTCRIGLHKYTTANRQYGYQLHLERIERLAAKNGKKGSLSPKWRRRMRYIGWEEAQRARRIVEPALFRRLYVTRDASRLSQALDRWGWRWLAVLVNTLRTDTYTYTKETKDRVEEYRKGGRVSGAGYPWFDLAELTRPDDRDADLNLGPNSLYYGGSYLRNMLNILILLQWVALLPLGLSVVQGVAEAEDPMQALTEWHLLTRLVLLTVLIAFVALRWNRLRLRTRILEDGLLSIHACAITWHVAVVAHYRALKKTTGFRHYSECLTEEAVSAARCVFDPYAWIQRQSSVPGSA